MFYIHEREWFQDGCEKVKTVPLQPKDQPFDTIPLAIAEEAYKEYAANFSEQNLHAINRRGGFGTVELISFLYLRCRRLQAETEKHESVLKLFLARRG